MTFSLVFVVSFVDVLESLKLFTCLFSLLLVFCVCGFFNFFFICLLLVFL